MVIRLRQAIAIPLAFLCLVPGALGKAMGGTQHAAHFKNTDYD
jgi:hypothetical protein